MLNCNKILNAASHGDFVHYNILQDHKKIVTIDFEYFETKKILSFDLFNWYFTPLFTNINRFKLDFLSNFLIKLLFYFLKKTNFLYNYKINKIFFNDKYFFYFLIEKYIFYYNETKKNLKNKIFLNSINLILEKYITLTSKKYINKFNYEKSN